jgi:hypothetical protein
LQPAELWIGGAIDRRVADSGYAWPVQGGVTNPRFDYWQYPYLESGFAHHFVDSLFGRLHTFELIGTLPGGLAVISFCPRRDGRNRIEGELVIASDGRLRKASWKFITRSHPEDAGGMAIFPLTPDEEWPVPVPLLGLFWRKRVVDYLQEVWEFRDWETVPDSSRR